MLDLSIMDAGFMLAAAIALGAGVLSFLSPCVLPVVPPYLAYMSGISLTGADTTPGVRRSVVVSALLFVMGLSTVFLLMGVAASALGRAFLQYQPIISKGAGLVVIVFGLHFLHVVRLPILDRDIRLDAGDRGGRAFGAYLLGLAFAFGWTPCIGPQLGAILSMAATESSMARGTALLAIYAFGLGIPFLLVAVFLTRSQSLMNRLKRHLPLIERLMGLLLLLVGLALVTNVFSRLSFWLLETFPALASFG